jgi:hypothetical protein
MFRKSIVTLLLGFGLCLLHKQVQAQGLSVSPSRMFFTGNAGKVVSQQLEFRNNGSELVALRAAVKDWQRDSLGEKVYADPGTFPASNARWLDVVPDLTEIPAGGKAMVTVFMRIPEGAPAGGVTNAMLFFTQVNEQKAFTQQVQGHKVGINIKLEMGVHVYYTPGMKVRKEIDFVAFEDRGLQNVAADTVQRLAVKIKNSGEVMADGHIRLELTDKDTGEEIKYPGRAISMLPGAEQTVFLDIRPLKGHKHVLAVALLDCGPDTDLKVAEKDLAYE